MSSKKTVLGNVRLFDGHCLTLAATVHIAGGHIQNVSVSNSAINAAAAAAATDDDAEMIDCQGNTLLPGLIDAHVHLDSEADLVRMIKQGITTALDMATWPPAKVDSLRNLPHLTDIRSPGLPATSNGSIHSHLLPSLPASEFLAVPTDATRFVAARVSEGADYIKVIADVPGPDQKSMDALVTAAHEHGKLVIAHASSFEPFRMALDAGVDVLTHVPADKALDDELVAQMVEDKRVAVPTLAMMEALMKLPKLSMILGVIWAKPGLFIALLRSMLSSPYSWQKQYKHAKESVSRMYAAGVPILAGSDAHVDVEGGPVMSVLHGDALHRELELLLEAGLSNVDALRAATVLPARHFGLHDRGSIEVGKRADLVLVEGDPTEDITATRRILKVWLAGEEVQVENKVESDVVDLRAD